MSKMYFLAKIKNGSKVRLDLTIRFKWPQSDYEDTYGVFKRLTDDTVFITRKLVHSDTNKFECVAPGYGEDDDYGSGSLLVEDVEILTAGSLVRPSEEDRLNMEKGL